MLTATPDTVCPLSIGTLTAQGPVSPTCLGVEGRGCPQHISEVLALTTNEYELGLSADWANG